MRVEEKTKTENNIEQIPLLSSATGIPTGETGRGGRYKIKEIIGQTTSP